MRLRISSELSLPWDDSSDSFYSESDSEDTHISEPHQIPEPPNPPNQGEQPIINLYQPPPPPRPHQNLLTTLRSWVLPHLPNQLPNPPANPIDQGELPIPTIIKIEAIPTITRPNSTPLNQTQTILPLPTANHHWGDPMIIPKPLNTFRVLSRNVNTLSTQYNYLQWRAASQAIFESDTDTIALQETNLSWNKIHKKHIRQSSRSHQAMQSLQPPVARKLLRNLTNVEEPFKQ